MRGLWRGLVLIVAFSGFLAGGLMGGCAVFGLVAGLWGPEVLGTGEARLPDRSHPGFWLGVTTLVPAMLFGMVGAFFGWVVPLCYFTGTRLTESRDWLLLSYARWLRALAQPTGDYRAALRPPPVPRPPLSARAITLACVRVGAVLSAFAGVWLFSVLAERDAPNYGALQVTQKEESAPGRYNISATSEPNKNGGT